MTPENNTVDLIRLSDGDNTFRVRVLGRRSPGILPTHDLLDAEAVIESSFVNGRLDICFHPADLESWSRILDSLDVGRAADWLDTGNGPVIKIDFPEDDPRLPVIQVEDTSASGTSATIPITAGEGWVEEQRHRLNEVLQAWPSEVRRTSPGAYEWRR
ncbi:MULTISPECIES: DUF5959 family protein [unclassified Streptomyces]|uniref:DUF5959 family protein n=1 Tax=unclassified Streptomyces TaxID=2593676 RepID=UPI0038242EBA